MDAFIAPSIILFDALWILLMVFMLNHFYKKLKIFHRTKDWLTAKGRITELKWQGKAPYLWPRIEYTYQVNEQNYWGEHLVLDSALSVPFSRRSRQIAYKAVMAYQQQEEIEVHYNPHQPAQSALDIETPKKLKIIIYLLLTLLAVQIAMVFRHWA